MAIPFDEAKVLMNTSDGSYRGRGNGNRGRGAYSGGRNGSGRGRGSKFCTYCNRMGHVVDTCYKKHGYPPCYFQKDSNANNCMMEEEIEDDIRSVRSMKLKEDADDGWKLSFTPEQHKAILAMLQQSRTSHNANQIVTQTAGKSGILCTVSNIVEHDSWIIDTGATDHVCHSLSLLQCHKRIRPVLIKLLDGSQVSTNIAGAMMISYDICLTDVLYIPQFTFNLISVSRMVKTSSCELIFDYKACHIQDNLTLKKTGTAKLKGGLYTLNCKAGACFSFHSENAISSNKCCIWHMRLGHSSHDRLLQLNKCFPFIKCNKLQLTS